MPDTGDPREDLILRCTEHADLIVEPAYTDRNVIRREIRLTLTEGDPMNHRAIVDGPSLDGTYSWFCPETVEKNCPEEHFGFTTYEEALAAAAQKPDHPIVADDELPGLYDGMPGLVYYSNVTPTRGDELKIGDWLDSLDHSGARAIYGIQVTKLGCGYRTVCFSGGFEVYDDGSSDTEVVRDDVMYNVVDPNSQVDPAGNPTT